MRKVLLFIAGLFLTIEISAGQIVRLQTGLSRSRLSYSQSPESVKGFNEPFIGYNVFLGIDYLNRKYFNLSGNLGYLTKKGEQSYIAVRPNGGSDIVTNNSDLGYLSVNTTFDLKYPVRDVIIPFTSIGPRLDYLVLDLSESRWTMIRRAVYGLTFGGGMKFQFTKIQIGWRFDHYLNFIKNSELIALPSYTGFLPVVPITERTSLFSLTLAYKIR